MNKIYVKICGITRVQDAKIATDLGVDAIGLVFFSGSKRCVSIQQAQEIVAALPAFVTVVALFVNETSKKINEILTQVPVDVLQFHGDESPEFCQQFHRPYLKAVRVQQADDVINALRDYADARAVLFDAFVSGVYGGTGHCFDWKMLPENIPNRWILSGGLNPDNIADALRQTRAKAVDVSSGVEMAAGIKSADKMAAFLYLCQHMAT